MPSIYLSPSNQERNIGAGNYGTEEQVMNRITDVTQRELIRHDVTVFRNLPDMSVEQIVWDSDAKKPTFHLPIHSNAYNKARRGCEVYCHLYGGEGERFSKIIYDELSKITPTSDNGVRQGANFYGPGKHMYELAYTDCPASLIEIDYHDNPDSAKWILDNVELIGVTIAKACLKYFNIPYVEIVDNSHDCNWLKENGFTKSLHKRADSATKGWVEDVLKNKFGSK